MESKGKLVGLFRNQLPSLLQGYPHIIPMITLFTYITGVRPALVNILHLKQSTAEFEINDKAGMLT